MMKQEWIDKFRKDINQFAEEQRGMPTVAPVTAILNNMLDEIERLQSENERLSNPKSIRIFATGHDDVEKEITDLYWFEENDVHVFIGGDVYDDQYSFRFEVNDE